MYLMTCTRLDLAYPLSLLARYVAFGRHRKVHWDAAKRVLCYLCSTSGMGLVLGGRGPVVLTGHADASWVDDSATQRSSQGYKFSLGSGSVSWQSTRSSSVLSSSCEAEIYAGAMAALELCWPTYLLTNLGEQPRSPPVLYIDNKAMIALCQEHRLEHRTKHIALRYFLAQDLQQHGQLRLAYVASRANTANIFTKALPPRDHQRFSTLLGLPNGQQGQRGKPSGGGSGGGRSMKDVDQAKSARDKGRGGGGQQWECWICHDPEHLSYECPECDDSDEDDNKIGCGRATNRRPRRDEKPLKENQMLKKTSSTKGVVSSSGKGRSDGEALCSMVGVVEPTVSLVPEAGMDFQVVAAAVQANPMAVLLDSGCSHHLMGTKAVFVDMAPSGSVKHLVQHTFSDKGLDAKEAQAVVHIDLCRPFGVAAKDGSMYFLLLKHRHTRFVRAVSVAKKSDMLREFEKWLVLVERQTKKSVLMLRSDRGGEFLRTEFTNFVDGKGIVHDLTCSDTQQQNGMAEWEMRTVVESVRMMLPHMGVQHHWWHLALQQAVWVLGAVDDAAGDDGAPAANWEEARPHAGVSVGLRGAVHGSRAAAWWEANVEGSLGASPVFTSLDVWKAKYGRSSGRTQTHPPTDTLTATFPLLAEVDEPADEDIEEVLPPPPVLAPPHPVADRPASTPMSAAGDEGSLEVSPVALASGITSG
ncbi:unnamed protein product [Closterium sp. NIES-53]